MKELRQVVAIRCNHKMLGSFVKTCEAIHRVCGSMGTVGSKEKFCRFLGVPIIPDGSVSDGELEFEFAASSQMTPGEIRKEFFDLLGGQGKYATVFEGKL